MAEKAIPQIQELIKNYNPDIMWFDTPHKLPIYLNLRILQAIREVDPENKIVVNGRLANLDDINFGDYENTGDRAAFFRPFNGLWECIPTTNESYGYSAVDTIRKSDSFFIRLLTSAVSKGGNILLNVGPKGNGKWDERDVKIFNRIGNWLKINGESIYGTEKTDLPIQAWGVTTRKGDTLYAHVYNWPDDGKLVIGGLRSNIKKAWSLNNKTLKISHKRINKDDYVLNVPKEVPDTCNSVIAMVLANQEESNTCRLLDDKRSNTLYTFDAQLEGDAFSFGDGKPNRNFVAGWKNKSQLIKWTFRLNKSTTYDVYLDYNTQDGKTDKGTVNVTIGNQSFDVNYTPYAESDGTKSLYVGKVNLKKETNTCMLKGKKFEGKTFMRPIAIRLEK